MSQYKAYPAYKDSGVEWIGQVPEHWEATKLKHVAAFSGGGTPSKENPDYWNGCIPWVSPKDMKHEVITDSIDHITTKGLENSATKLIDSGAVLLVARSGILRHTIPVGINNVPVSLNQDMKALSLDETRVRPRFILRWVQGLNRSLLGIWAKEGATVESLEHEYVANTRLPLPDLKEQDAILATLDRETARIDSLIQKKTRFIELLKEKRQALITHAVTKGLDPNVKMKDSGIEWIGQVPEHWRLRKVAWDMFMTIGWTPPTGESRFYNGQHNWVSIADLSAGRITKTKTKITDAAIEEKGAKPAPAGSVLFSYKLTVGEVALLEEPAYTNGLLTQICA